MSIHSVATELLETQPWDFAAVYYSAIDHFGHAFMRYHPPRLPSASEEDFAIYRDVIANGYRYHDAMLGVLLGLAGKDTTVILMSDHGFHPDHLRPGYIPAEPAGPAVEHRHYGIVCLKGPGLRVGERLFGAGLLDICPTILTLFGLPPGKDMDGKVLVTAFTEPPRVEPIESWDKVSGEAGTHSAETRLDPAASAAAFKQLVELGYVAPPAENVQQTVDESVRELKYNLARAYRDGNCCSDAAALGEELWQRWPKEHRFGILLIECLGPMGQLERRRAAIDELARRIDQYQTEAKQALEARKGKSEDPAGPAPSPRGENSPKHSRFVPLNPPLKTQKIEDEVDGDRRVRTPEIPTQADSQKRRARFEEHQLRELAHGRPFLVDWLFVTQALLEKDRIEARRRLEKLMAAEDASHVLGERLAGALTQLGDLDNSRVLLEQALEWDPENALVHAQLAGIHFEAGRYDESIAAATESLSLLYFQPAVHALLGQALLEAKRFNEAEQALLVAVAQSPRHLAAHNLLARLYRDHLARPSDAFAHEGRARSLRHELAARSSRKSSSLAAPKSDEGGSSSSSPFPAVSCDSGVPPPFAPAIDRSQIITVVSGLPRSGTSMMMQLLVAAGLPALADGQRPPDEDNPLGYFEYKKATTLVRDSSWLPEARGKVIKIVAQLLPTLPPGEHYQVILMERNLSEVAASQKAMLTRHGRSGAALDEHQLIETYRTQLERIRRQLARRPDVRLLQVDYGKLLAEPAAGIERLARFMGEPFDREAAVISVRPALRRQRHRRSA
jgi:tetratricopeptide (TPR) repeat protein